ncbi:hypothetical protein WJX72_011286 [[Myrmecia] bisecta]|uniref:Uncharacterized protein n=1 Tax=[Myrmecia] bisecta TaxID=41462 RepID=A0AAW1QTF1_9CHLO
MTERKHQPADIDSLIDQLDTTYVDLPDLIDVSEEDPQPGLPQPYWQSQPTGAQSQQQQQQHYQPFTTTQSPQYQQQQQQQAEQQQQQNPQPQSTQPWPLQYQQQPSNAFRHH